MDASSAFDEHATADLVVDRTYVGGSAGHVGDDPLARLLPVGNQGGFRYAGSPEKDTVRVAALYTTGGEPDWPDSLNSYSGDFTYYGDNRSPGKGLHETQRKGNLLLRSVFEWSQSNTHRAQVPPFFLFDRPGTSRAVRFRGLLAPGSPALSAEEELVAVWRTSGDARFQNYRAHFTVLDVPEIGRAWLTDIGLGNPLGKTCPEAWRLWDDSRSYTPLKAPPTTIVRTKTEQLPASREDMRFLEHIHSHFSPKPTEFEQFAADLWARADPHVEKIDVTRPWRDGGRDAVGEYMIGPTVDPVAVEFALEAKCYAPGKNSVGVREVSRLISRLRHRQFGVLVTTSCVDRQAYKEIRDDGHPIVIISGQDLVQILKGRGIDSSNKLSHFLLANYPLAPIP